MKKKPIFLTFFRKNKLISTKYNRFIKFKQSLNYK